MNLTLDFGNTSIKAGAFDGGKLIRSLRDVQLPDLQQLVDEVNPSYTIASSVNNNIHEIEKIFEGRSFMNLTSQTPLPFTIDYDTPHTLGLDRIAAVAGAQDIYPGENCLIIDAGTCITYEFIDKSGIYHGGGISPGMNMRLKAMHNFTAKLPLVDFEPEVNLIGKSTRDCILSGAINGTIAEIREIIRMYSDKFADLRIIMCGGDTNFFENKLKASIFAAPELVLRGLNRILLYNVQD